MWLYIVMLKIKCNDMVVSLLGFLLSSILQQGSIGSGGSSSNSSGSTEEGPLDSTLTTHFTNAGVAVLEAPKDGPSQHADRSKRYIVEHVDLGAYYYRKYFYLRGEQNNIVFPFLVFRL